VENGGRLSGSASVHAAARAIKLAGAPDSARDLAGPVCTRQRYHAQLSVARPAAVQSYIQAYAISFGSTPKLGGRRPNSVIEGGCRDSSSHSTTPYEKMSTR